MVHSIRMTLYPVIIASGLFLNLVIVIDGATADDRRVPVCVNNKCTIDMATDGGEIYCGGWANGAPEGRGTYENDELKYVGESKNGRFEGKGVVTCYRRDREFEGTFIDGKLDGKPIYPWYGSKILLRFYNLCE